MGWYKTGSINLVQGSKQVVGVGTDFVTNVNPGAIFCGPDGRIYEVDFITSATAPVRTTNPEPSPEDERLRRAASRGDATFRLLNAFPSPANLDGHLAEVKGFLIRGSIDTINVTALTSVTSSCP